jgi:predicted esterase
MEALPAPKASTYISDTTSAFSAGSIDDPANMASQRYYLFSGTQDTTVSPKVMSVLNSYLQNFVASNDQIVFKDDLVGK